MKSRLLKNCRILEGDELVQRHLFLEDHKISYIADEIITADEVIDIKNNIVIPGLIDPHVHCREPGLTHKEDFLSASIAAAKGGITTILDMPNTIPPTITVENLKEKRKLAEKSIVNYGFHFGATFNNIPEIKQAKNIASVKIFMNVSTGNLRIENAETVESIMKESRLCTIHAEEDNLKVAAEIAEKLKKRFYACHISSENELAIVKKHRKYIYSEVTPHHLFITEKDKERLGKLADVKPTIKADKDREALWKGIEQGLIDTIGTDHAPHQKEEKLNEERSGLPGLETMLPLLLDAVNKKQLTLKQVIEFTSKNPAKIFKIRNKGQIKEGYDADLTVIDLDLEKEVKADELLTKTKWSPFEGKILKGWPLTTFVNGQIVFDRGNIYEVRAKEVKYDHREINKESKDNKLTDFVQGGKTPEEETPEEENPEEENPQEETQDNNKEGDSK